MLARYRYLIILIALIVPFFANAQVMGRGPLQQRFFITNVIEPQFKVTPKGMPLTSAKSIDTICHKLDTAWQRVSATYYKNNPNDLTPEQFNQLDAYVYFWGVMSLTQTLPAHPNYMQYLAKHYMIPATQHDYETVKAKPTASNIQLIHGGSLGNTLGIGTAADADKETFLACYDLYKKFDALFRTLSTATDTAVASYAKAQLQEINGGLNYDLNARYALYADDVELASKYLLDGLTNHSYPRSRVWNTGKKLINAYNASGNKERSFTILNAVLANTTADVINRDTIRNWFVKTDAVRGEALYQTAQLHLKGSYKKNGKKIVLPANWKFIANAIPAERLKKVKYYFVDVWTTGCGPCLEEVPELNQLSNKYKNRDDILFISISADQSDGRNAAFVAKRAKELHILFPVVYDNRLSKLEAQLEVKGYPSKYIFNAKGELLVKKDDSRITLDAFDLFVKELN